MGRSKPRGRGPGQGVLLSVLGVMPEPMVDAINRRLERIARLAYQHRGWLLPLAIMAYGLSTLAQVVVFGGVKPSVILYTSLAFVWAIVFTVGGPGMFGDPDAGMGAAPVRA